MSDTQTEIEKLNMINQLISERDTLRAQRDRLREALKAIVDSGEIPYSESSPLIIAARTTLAEGEST